MDGSVAYSTHTVTVLFFSFFFFSDISKIDAALRDVTFFLSIATAKFARGAIYLDASKNFTLLPPRFNRF